VPQTAADRQSACFYIKGIKLAGRLNGKVAVITGAAGNIGQATALRFLAEGARVVAVDRNAEGLRTIRDSNDDNLLTVSGDVTSESDTLNLLDAAMKRFGKIDIFFANAGVEGVIRHLPDYPTDVLDNIMAVNVKGVFLAMKHIAPRMSDGGSFIVTSSIMGLMGVALNGPYAASKHAVVGLMRSAAIDFAPRRIRFNSIHPGLVQSEMFNRLVQDHEDPDAKRKAALASIKLGRWILPSDISSAVLFFASDDSSMVTGQTLAIEGGQLL
jgi:NAD(P)-dependent dehydrogenase (short-subunit alcohol dehydrogenase family)